MYALTERAVNVALKLKDKNITNINKKKIKQNKYISGLIFSMLWGIIHHSYFAATMMGASFMTNEYKWKKTRLTDYWLPLMIIVWIYYFK